MSCVGHIGSGFGLGGYVPGACADDVISDVYIRDLLLAFLFVDIYRKTTCLTSKVMVYQKLGSFLFLMKQTGINLMQGCRRY